VTDPLTLLAELQSEVASLRERVAVLENGRESNGDQPWLTLTEAADRARVSERTIERLVTSKRIRSTTLGRRRLLHRDDLDELLRGGDGGGVARTAPPRRRGVG
jgi:excisionase family DNA binding protein